MNLLVVIPGAKVLLFFEKIELNVGEGAGLLKQIVNMICSPTRRRSNEN